MLDLYFKYFFKNQEEKSVFLTEFNQEAEAYKNIEKSEWLKIEQDFKALLPYGHLEDFNIEININASTIINQIFSKYVDENTLVVTALVHDSIANNRDKIKPENSLNLSYSLIEDFDINYIIDYYKHHNYTKIFIYGAGIIESNVVPQAFYVALKDRLIEEGIDHYIVLDDVQSMFIIPRDYSIFDSVIFTCHSLLPKYDSGIVLSKKIENFGFKDCSLKQFINLIKQNILPKLNKLFLFSFMIEQYLAEELKDQAIFHKPKNRPWNIFFLHIQDKRLSEKIIDKYKQDLAKYFIDFHNNLLIIKATFVLQLSQEDIIEGFKKLKEVLQKCIKLKDRL